MEILYSKYLTSCVPKWTYISFLIKNSGNIYLKIEKKFLLNMVFFQFYHMNSQFKLFSDLVVADYPTNTNRFLSIYNILSIQYNRRLFCYFWSNELDSIDSLTSFHPASNWYEREMYDLFGVHYEGNSDLRRILSDYGFTGHPFRKDFPLVGYFELTYDTRINSIITNNTSLVQDYRSYSLSLPWEH